MDTILISDWSTVSSDFSLVCGRDYLVSLAQERANFATSFGDVYLKDNHAFKGMKLFGQMHFFLPKCDL